MNTRREDAHRAVLLITCLLISLILASQILLAPLPAAARSLGGACLSTRLVLRPCPPP